MLSIKTGIKSRIGEPKVKSFSFPVFLFLKRHIGRCLRKFIRLVRQRTALHTQTLIRQVYRCASELRIRKNDLSLHLSNCHLLYSFFSFFSSRCHLNLICWNSSSLVGLHVSPFLLRNFQLVWKKTFLFNIQNLLLLYFNYCIVL